MKFRAPLEPGEYVVSCNRAHPAKLLRPAVVVLTAIFLANLVQVLAGEHPAWAPVAPILVIAALIYAASRVYRWMVTAYALTSRRIVIFRTLRGKRPLAIPLEQVIGVVGPRGGLHRLTGHGTVRVAVPGQAFELTCQREPARFVEVCEEYRRRRFTGRRWSMPGV